MKLRVAAVLAFVAASGCYFGPRDRHNAFVEALSAVDQAFHAPPGQTSPLCDPNDPSPPATCPSSR